MYLLCLVCCYWVSINIFCHCHGCYGLKALNSERNLMSLLYEGGHQGQNAIELNVWVLALQEVMQSLTERSSKRTHKKTQILLP